jgi:hypothetical protein
MGVQTTIKGMGYAVDDTDIASMGDGKADDVECKDSNYDMNFDKNFKVTGTEKED